MSYSDEVLWKVLTKLDQVSLRLDAIAGRLEKREVLDRRLDTLEHRWDSLSEQIRSGRLDRVDLDLAQRKQRAIAEVLALFDPHFAIIANIDNKDTDLADVLEAIRAVHGEGEEDE